MGNLGDRVRTESGAGQWWIGILSVAPIKSLCSLALLYFVASSNLVTSRMRDWINTAQPLLENRDHKIVPSLDKAAKTELILNSGQLSPRGGLLRQTQTKITTNGHFTVVIPQREPLKTEGAVRVEGGVEVKAIFHPNLYVSVQTASISNIDSVALYACNVALVLKLREKVPAIFFWSSEQDASAQNIPIKIDVNKLNTIALRQVDKNVTAFVNGESVASFRFNRSTTDCSPALTFKVWPYERGEAEFQGLAIYEFQ